MFINKHAKDCFFRRTYVFVNFRETIKNYNEWTDYGWNKKKNNNTKGHSNDNSNLHDTMPRKQ